MTRDEVEAMVAQALAPFIGKPIVPQRSDRLLQEHAEVALLRAGLAEEWRVMVTVDVPLRSVAVSAWRKDGGD